MSKHDSTSAAVPKYLHDLVSLAAGRDPGQPALISGNRTLSYRELDERMRAFAAGLDRFGLAPQDRVAIFLPKTIECVTGFFGTAAAGGAFVPVNPILKPAQVAHILRDSGARILLTAAARLSALLPILDDCPALELIILTDDIDSAERAGAIRRQTFSEFIATDAEGPAPTLQTDDLTAIFYTSGSTGQPKGVMLSHRNMVTGAVSVAGYLENSAEDRILSVLPFSFDAGFSQLTTGLHAGATIVLMDYLLAGDVGRMAAKHGITGITGVPPLWSQLADINWPEEARRQLRYFATTGGVMPRRVLDTLRSIFPQAKPYLMYGLTEAFRSTYLAPEEIDRRPDSIGKAIPNAEILVLTADGSPCPPGETGELVHCGPLVALGYWQAPEKTAQRFRPVPGRTLPDGSPEIAVWSGDSVRQDDEGFLYFEGRQDEMIKTSGYRVSPGEIEESLMASGLVTEIVALGLPDERLGQQIAVAAVRATDDVTTDQLLNHCRSQFPAYMLPARVLWQDQLPRNANGKFDRVQLKTTVMNATDGDS